MSITETPHAEDFAAELYDLVEEYLRRGLSDEWAVRLLKAQVEDMEDEQ